MKRTKQTSFARFYALMKKYPMVDKETMVMQFTDGRTTHLREMYRDEYDEMCNAIEGRQSESLYRTNLRRWRSSVLLRLQRLGISTVDNWDGIDEFCMSPRIAGKKFAALTADELKALVPKLEGILRKGGLKMQEEAPKESAVHVESPAEILTRTWMTYRNRYTS